MEGAVLETPEFAYLLATLHATSIVGVVDAELFPADQADQEATYQEGLDKLKEHGWVRPIEDAPGEQYHLNSQLLYMASVIAEPEFVVFTIRNLPETGQQVFLHYLAASDIVELSITGERQYTLLLIPDRRALLERIKELLGLPSVIKAAPRMQFTIDESVFFTIQYMAEQGERDKAASTLEQHGVNGAAGESLLNALQAADSGSLMVVVRPKDGEIVAGRKATIFHLPDVLWLARRVDADSNTLQVEVVQEDTFETVLSNYLEYLSK